MTTTTPYVFKATNVIDDKTLRTRYNSDGSNQISVAVFRLNGQHLQGFGDTDAEAAAALNERIIEFIWHGESH